MAKDLSEKPVDSQPAMGNRHRVRVSIAALLLGMLISALDQTIVSTALPTIVSDLGGMSHLSWVVTAYLLASTAATPLWGKLGDQYGRKKLYQAAIMVFLVGSALCGLAQNMSELIAFRALQGLGGGGLMVLSMAIVGDIVPPRDRGRYQGLFGAVFGATSVLGPLLGGLFVDHLSWRWVFYINLPVGFVALLVIAAALRTPVHAEKHRIDYLGTLLVAAVATCLILVTSLGGKTWGWASASLVGTATLGTVLLVCFLLVERRAAEPVLPLKLFLIRTFALSSAISFVIGFAMFGAMTYLPTFLQIVRGVSPTMSGVHMLPMVLGLLLTSTVSGQIVSRTGRWKIFPVLGTAVTAAGLLLLHRLKESSGDFEMSLCFFLFGLGLGLVMQVLVLIVQNAVSYEDLGVATSGVTFFRSIGSAFGVAVFGTIFTNRLDDKLHGVFAGTTRSEAAAAALEADPRAMASLPPELRLSALHAYATSITDVFLYAAPIVLLAFAFTWFLREDRLRGSVTAPDMAQTISVHPVHRSSREEVHRALSVLGSREGRRGIYEKITAIAGYDLLPASSWLLLRALQPERSLSPTRLSEYSRVPLPVIEAALQEIEQHHLATREGMELALTAAGHEAAAKLSAAREDVFTELFGDWWGPGRPTDLVELADELTSQLPGSHSERAQAMAPRHRERTRHT
ncbi:DHA2 family efflux MFS transporter permease subunit [Streptomyces sp. NPDC090088]|uniref:MDR family MFS transporter n=1 Tax=Streptomyces sp. NPDC090088 TaxID=3365944 RepID=UPI003826B961